MVIAVTKYEPSSFILMEMWRALGKGDKMADFGSAFYWEWELLLGVVKGHVK